MNRDIPHLNIVVGACIVSVAGYALFSIYAVVILRDATMTGDIIGTWKSFAVAAIMFWLGSSSGGKTKDVPEPPADQRDGDVPRNSKGPPT
jgi:hypothetical protein